MKLEISEYAKIHNMSEEEIYRAHNEGKIKLTRNKEGLLYVHEIPPGDSTREVDTEYGHPVYVTDIRMDFGSMIAFMVKASFAAIPALIIVSLIVGVTIALLSGGVGILSR